MGQKVNIHAKAKLRPNEHAPFGYCTICGHPLAWSGSQDIGDDEEEYQLDNYSCSHCGCQTEVIHQNEEEKKDYPFWNKDKLVNNEFFDCEPVEFIDKLDS